MSNYKENKNLVPCKICEQKVSINAKICPNCGEAKPNISLEEKTKIDKILLIFILSPLLFAIGAGGIALYFLHKLTTIFSTIG